MELDATASQRRDVIDILEPTVVSLLPGGDVG